MSSRPALQGRRCCAYLRFASGLRRSAMAVALLTCASLSTGRAQRAPTPADATVFIRVIGTVQGEVTVLGNRETFVERGVEIGTGSGFVITPFGHILTNHHVVSGGEIVGKAGPNEVRAQIIVERLEAVFPRAAESGDTMARLGASVYASDPDLDLAVLYVSSAQLPYLPLGDSDAITPGENVQVFGFPFGRNVEVGRIDTPDIVPQVSVSTGAVSAVRDDTSGEARFLQMTNTVNPGNSGGPMLDDEGFVVGVVRMKLARAEGVGFAIAVNVVKDFLERRGIDALLPARRLRLGPAQTFEGKAIRLRLPLGFDDVSRFRVRLDSGGAPEEIAFRADRVVSPFGPPQLEQALVTGGALERFTGFVRTTAAASRRAASRRVLLGRATEDDRDMEYAIVDLGAEKIIAVTSVRSKPWRSTARQSVNRFRASRPPRSSRLRQTKFRP